MMTTVELKCDKHISSPHPMSLSNKILYRQLLPVTCELCCTFKQPHTTAHFVPSLLSTKLMNDVSHKLLFISSKHFNTDHTQDHLEHFPIYKSVKSNTIPHYTTSAILLHW